MFSIRLFTLCSDRDGALVIVMSDGPCEKNRKMGDLSDFVRGQIIFAHLAGPSVKIIATLLGVSIATLSKVISAYTNYENTS
jgi:hypothetical protein